MFGGFGENPGSRIVKCDELFSGACGVLCFSDCVSVFLDVLYL